MLGCVLSEVEAALESRKSGSTNRSPQNEPESSDDRKPQSCRPAMNGTGSTIFREPVRAIRSMLWVYVAMMAWRTRMRIHDWKDDWSLFTSALDTCPNSAKLHNQVLNSVMIYWLCFTYGAGWTAIYG